MPKISAEYLELDRAIVAHSAKAFGFLEALVRQPSVLGSEQGALDVFVGEAKSLGLLVTKLPFSNGQADDGRAGVAPLPELLSADRYQVLAATPGTGELALLLNGHIDVVPAETARMWSTPPFQPRRYNGRLYGRGAADMKSGFAIGMLALRALLDVTPEIFATRRLGFVAVVEEECTGNGTLRSITEHGVRAPEVVVLEPTDLGLMVGGVGVMWIDIGVVAASGHAESAGLRVNAVELGMRVVAALGQWAAEIRRREPEPSMDAGIDPYTVNLGKVRSGDWTSTAPSTAVFSVRMGFPRGWTAEFAEHELRQTIRTLAAADPAFPEPPSVTLTGFRAMGYLLDSDAPLVRDLSAAHTDAHGAAPAVFTLGTTTDARIYLGQFGIPAVCFGATGHDLHGIDESVELESIVAAARTLARFIHLRLSSVDIAP